MAPAAGAAQAGGVHEVDLLEAEQAKEFFDDYKKALQEVGGAEAQVADQVTEVETARPCKGWIVAYLTRF